MKAEDISIGTELGYSDTSSIALFSQYLPWIFMVFVLPDEL
jgi:hypothetical protein